MSRYFKLIDVIDTPTTLNVARRQDGVVKYGHVRLEPGKKYVLDHDEVLEKSLQGAAIKEPYSRELVEKLNKHQIPYEEVYCHTCGGRTRKISYVIVEVNVG